MAAKHRKLIAGDELISIINSELRKYEECQDCYVKGILRLAELDEGCNWSSSFVLSGHGTEICAKIAGKIINDLRGKYNVM